MNVRRYDEAIAQLRSTLELEPSYAMAQFWLGNLLELKGDAGGAVAAYLACFGEVLLPERVPRDRAALATAYARSGWPAFWQRELGLAEEESRSPGTVYKTEYARFGGTTFMALRHARLGHRDITLSLLERAYEERQHMVASLNSNPMWDGLRAEPRFKALIRRIGLEPDATIR